MNTTNFIYRGQLAAGEVSKIDFNKLPRRAPLQKIIKLDGGGTMIVFTNGKFRLMGLKQPLNDLSRLPFNVLNIQPQTFTVSDSMGVGLNLLRIARQLTSRHCQFEPELFPAVRLTDFKPICVNVFATGKIVLLGVRDFTKCNELVLQVKTQISDALLNDLFSD